MSNYRRADQPGGTYFFTLVTHNRRPLFADAENIERLRAAIKSVMLERPFDFIAGVILPDHAHYLWTLPPGDSDFSTRIGRMKALFTKSIRTTRRVGTAHHEKMVGSAHPTEAIDSSRSPSRIKHRDGDVWQRRFWEHCIRDAADLNRHLDYIHFNPVKHGLASCPHAWPASSFGKWVAHGGYDRDWCCQCDARSCHSPDFTWASATME